MTQRLNLLKWARAQGINHACAVRHRVLAYEPCHIRYQFGHYPTRRPYHPTEEDWRLLDLYAQWGGGVVHLWYWNEWCGLFGKGVFDALNEPGLRQFIDEVHRRGLKIIPYVSPGYLDVSNVDYQPQWSRGAAHLVELNCDFDLLCPGSPGWRRYFMAGINKLLDDYGFDGVYWDAGIGPNRPGCRNPQADGHVHFIEADPAVPPAAVNQRVVEEGFFALCNDLLCELYDAVKRRNGLIVAHIGGDSPAPFEDRCWDYLLLGEGVPDVLSSVEKTKNYAPYILRFNDWSKLVTNWQAQDLTPDLERVPSLEHLAMAASIPYLQFPWLEDGCYGPRETLFNIPGTTWKQEYDHWTQWMKAQDRAGLAPLGNASWAAGRQRYGRYLPIYRQMTAANTVAHLEVGNLPNAPFPTTVGRRRVSIFINDALWVAIGNLEAQAQNVQVFPLAGGGGNHINLAPGKLTVLKYRDLASPPESITFDDI